MAIIIVLVIRDSENRDVIRVLTLVIDAGDGDVVIIIRVRFARWSRTAVLSPHPGSQIAIFSKLVLKQLQNIETNLSQVRDSN